MPANNPAGHGGKEETDPGLNKWEVSGQRVGRSEERFAAVIVGFSVLLFSPS